MTRDERTTRDALENELLREFDRRYPRALPSRRARFAPVLAAAALLACALFAGRAPANYSADLGQRIEVSVPASAALGDGSELADLVASGLGGAVRGNRHVEVRLMHHPGAGLLRIDVWGAPISGVVERLRARVPALAAAPIAVQALSGRVHGSVAGAVLHRLLRLHADRGAIEDARRALQAELAKEHGAAEVSIELGPDGSHRMRVKLKKGPANEELTR